MTKKTTKIPEKSAYTLAIELKEIRDELNVLKLAEKGVADELKARMNAGEEQDLFKFLPVTSLKVSNLDKAMKWAKKFAPNIITVNTTAARKVFLTDAFTGKLGTPEDAGFVLTTIEQLREVKVGEPEAGYDLA